eukprot:5082757-Prymnesium_polylepis.1
MKRCFAYDSERPRADAKRRSMESFRRCGMNSTQDLGQATLRGGGKASWKKEDMRRACIVSHSPATTLSRTYVKRAVHASR